MAGHSRRFKNAGYEAPKFLLENTGRPIISYVVDMFSEEDTFHFILNKEIKLTSDQESMLRSLMPNVLIYFVNPHELGPNHTINEADLMISNDSEIIVTYCDFTVIWNYESFKRDVYGYDASVPYFSGFHAASLGKTNYAYMKESNNELQKLQEKKPFTNNKIDEPASTGIYYFKSFGYFRELLKLLTNNNQELPNNESYTSLLLNEAVRLGDKVRLFKVEQFICLGTPEDYEQFCYWQDYFNRNSQYPDQDPIIAEWSIMPMAGKGNRFKEFGYKTSKPLIQIGNKSLIEKCISSLPKSKNSVYILKESDFVVENLVKDITKSDPAINKEFIHIEQPTTGQAATCLLAKDLINSSDSLLISSCDYEIIFDRDELTKLIKQHDPDVLLFTFKLRSMPVANYSSFAYCNESFGHITHISEKKCLSDYPQFDHMLTGTFWFKESNLFFQAATNLLEEDIRVNNEHYVGTSINYLIKSGFKVMSFEVNQWISFGDPAELELYYFWERFFNQRFS